MKARAPADADASAVRTRVAQQLGARLETLELERPISPRVTVERSKERVR